MYQAKEPVDKFQKFQQSKEQGMAIMASNRDATMIVCELMKWETKDEHKNAEWLQEQILYWRKWFYVNIYDTTPDNQLKQEAKETGNPSEILGF